MRLTLAIIMLATLARFSVAQEKAPQKSLPYVTVDHPEFIPPAQAGFLSDRDRVIGVMDGRIAKAYAAADLAQHGVVQDRLAAGPIAVTW